MKSNIFIPIIIGLQSAIFIVDACEAGKKAWNNIEVQFMNPQDSRNQTHTEMIVTFRLKGNCDRRLILITSKHYVPLTFLEN